MVEVETILTILTLALTLLGSFLGKKWVDAQNKGTQTTQVLKDVTLLADTVIAACKDNQVTEEEYGAMIGQFNKLIASAKALVNKQ